ncbi:MAG: HesB/IscA family protein [Fidelibacterota bacterium]
MTNLDEQILQDVTITKVAAERLLKIRTSDEGTYLRASVKGGGCSGMSYQLEWDNEKGEFDKVYHHHGIELIVDMKSLLYLQGMEIDFSTDLLSGGFRFNNPNAQRTCGCGTSFSV